MQPRHDQRVTNEQPSGSEPTESRCWSEPRTSSTAIPFGKAAARMFGRLSAAGRRHHQAERPVLL